MFLEIFKTVAKLGLLLLIFIIAFGLGFHIMLSDQVQVDLKESNISSIIPNLRMLSNLEDGVS